MFGNGYFNPGTSGGGGTPAGSTNDIQINDLGAFSVVGDFTIDQVAGTLQIPDIIQGRNIHNSATADTGANPQQIRSGTYTPVFSGGSVNMGANPTFSVANYYRIGNIVTVSGSFTADPVLAATGTGFLFTAPITSNSSSCYGLIIGQSGGNGVGTIRTGGGAIIFEASFIPALITAGVFFYSVTYLIT